MRDEDFVLGYVCGFNEGVGSGSGGGSGGEFSDIVIYKQYDFGDSGYGIAIPDFTKGNRFVIPYAIKTQNTDPYDYSGKNLSAIKYGPVYSWEVYPMVVCMTYNGQVRGFYRTNDPDSYFEEYSYSNGSFQLTNARFSPSVVSAELYKNGNSVYQTVSYRLTESGTVRSKSNSVILICESITLGRWYAPTGHGGDSFFRAWSIAYLKNGITGICDPINPYAQ